MTIPVRITEQVAVITEVSYDIEVPDKTGLHDFTEQIEDNLDRERDEVFREVISSQREITNWEIIG